MYFRVLRHLRDSSPGMMDVGGPFFDFGAVRTASHDANRGRGDAVDASRARAAASTPSS